MVPGTGTPLTLEILNEWKKKKAEEQRIIDEEEKKKKLAAKGKNVLTGAELFALDASIFLDEEGAESE